MEVIILGSDITCRCVLYNCWAVVSLSLMFSLTKQIKRDTVVVIIIITVVCYMCKQPSSGGGGG